jgi:thiol-disulfide isomerase/thioredoxin
MTTLNIGDSAPPFSLSTLSGSATALPLSKEPFSLLLFVKRECPTCRMTLPFFGRLVAAYGDKISFSIVTENEAPDGAEVARLAGVSAEVVQLEPEPWSTSSAYGVFSVPVLFEISADKTVAHSVLGWSSVAYEALNERLSLLTGRPKIALITQTDGNIPNVKPG